ncbi:hypothetical protein CDAR_229371 [Caerostris darwini]|uniref:Uncharacterized protein n=1 Tax=Caerostris darwini TaxID=1538125 RepID=A0AAV4THF0_9ARAC|nr:hypothetical protein CDAR_229371 [Caerostris darwini]
MLGLLRGRLGAKRGAKRGKEAGKGDADCCNSLMLGSKGRKVEGKGGCGLRQFPYAWTLKGAAGGAKKGRGRRRGRGMRTKKDPPFLSTYHVLGFYHFFPPLSQETRLIFAKIICFSTPCSILHQDEHEE